MGRYQSIPSYKPRLSDLTILLPQEVKSEWRPRMGDRCDSLHMQVIIISGCVANSSGWLREPTSFLWLA
jgi:hypothetical protein